MATNRTLWRFVRRRSTMMLRSLLLLPAATCALAFDNMNGKYVISDTRGQGGINTKVRTGCCGC